MPDNETILADFFEIFSAIPFNRTLGLKIQCIEADSITLAFTMRDDLVGNFLQNILHGGVISSVLDMAGGAAAIVSAVQKLPQQTIAELSTQLGKSSTVNLHVDYLRPGKGEQFVAKSWVLRSGNKITVTQMQLFNQDNTLIASATGTYLVG